MTTADKIFISHASADRKLADLLRDTLVLGGIPRNRIFYSSSRAYGIPSGTDVRTRLLSELLQAGLIIELVSTTFLTRPMCLLELGGAWALEKPTYPIVVPPLTRSQAVAQIGDVHTGQLGSSEEIDDVFDELHDRLVSDVGLSTTTTEWNPVARRFKEGLPAVLAAAQAAATTAETLSSKARQQRAGMESSGAAARLEHTGSATPENFDVASQLAQELRDTDEWLVHELQYSGRPRDPQKGRNDDPPGRRLIRILETLESNLRAVRGAVDDDPRAMDTLLEQTHQLVRRIHSIVKERVFSAASPWSLSIGREMRARESEFEETRADENDMYELYANDLERYRKLQLNDLDMVLKRRRAYISTLRVFHQQISAIVKYLYSRPSDLLDTDSNRP